VAGIVLALRTLRESRDERVQGRPDVAGGALVAGSVGLVVLALVRAPDWGWGSPRFLGTVAAALVCAAALIARSRRHPAPVLELGLFRARAFSATVGASLLYYAAFSVVVLSAVEFLTGVWHYSAVRAGLAIAPGPLVVLPVAQLVAPRLMSRFGGPGRVAVLGCLINAASSLLWLSQIQAQPAYLSHFLPVQLIGGVGVGLTIPSLLAAGSTSLPPARFGTGSGVLNMARQVGTALGVAGLVSILAHLDQAEPVATFRGAIYLVIALSSAAGLTLAVLLSRRPSSAPAAALAPEPG
jgi:MFS family permease